MPIWFGKPTIDDTRARHVGLLASHLGIEFTEWGDDFLRGTMPVEPRTRQPMGLLHGGASLVLAGASTAYATVALVLTAILACGVAGCVPLARRASFVALIHYFCLVQTAAAVGFVFGIFGRQSVLWQRFAHVPVADQLPQAGNGYGA